MNSVYPWMYVDNRDNVWKFSLNDNKELHYTIMYEAGKWTRETLIDKEVLGFAIYVEENETIHIAYSNINRELKYCTMKNRQWVGKILYEMELDEFEMQNLKVKIIGAEMHIFCLLVGNDGSDHGVIMHCIWNGKEIKTTTLYDIILAHNIKDHYMININEEKNIEMFFVTDEGDEIALNYCIYAYNKWSSIKRLYGIHGEDVGFNVLRDKQEIHILNRSEEDSIYFLDHVQIAENGDIKEFRVYESSKELSYPLIFIEDDKLCASWIEQGKIFYSIFEIDRWSSEIYFDRGNEISVSGYNCFSCYDGDREIKETEVYATNELDFYLYIPQKFLAVKNDTIIQKKIQTDVDVLKEETTIQKLRLELSRIKLEKKNLENKLESYGIQLQNKQKSIRGYEEELARLSEQKRKSDDNCKIIIELQQNIQKELENTSKQLSEAKKINADIDNKLQEYKEENIIIKEQVKKINEENKKLSKEIEFERNQSFMERLLKKKTNGI